MQCTVRELRQELIQRWFLFLGGNTWLWRKCGPGAESDGVVWTDARWTHYSDWSQLHVLHHSFYAVLTYDLHDQQAFWLCYFCPIQLPQCILAIIKLMQTAWSTCSNRQLLSIATRDDERRAPIQTIQMYDINSQDRPLDATDHQRNSALSPLLQLPQVWRWQQNHHGRASLVVCIHYGGRQATPVKSTDAGNAVCASVLLVLAVSWW